MDSRYDKEEALLNIALSAIPEGFTERKELAESIVNAFCVVTPPEEDSIIHNITLAHDISYTRKPGNILLNWKLLLQQVPDLGLTAHSLKEQNPLMIVFAGLKIAQIIISAARIELQQRHAFTLYMMWHHRNPRNEISEEHAFELINKQLANNAESPMAEAEFTTLIDDLIALRCIELVDGTIWLKEWVRITY